VQEATIAFVGNPSGTQGVDLDDFQSGEGVPYADFPAVTLPVAPDETLDRVLRRAAQELGVTGPGGLPFEPAWMSFYEPVHEQGYTTSSEMLYLTLVDQDGQAFWGVGVHDPRLTMGALERAQAVGVLDGDPTRPYLLNRPTYGNGILPDWSDLINGLVIIRDNLGVIADIAGTAAGVAWLGARIRRFRDRFKRVPEILEQKSPDWSRRSGFPFEVDGLIGHGLWTSNELAGLLGLPVSDIEAILSARGMSLDRRTGYWHLSEDPESRVVNELHTLAITHDWATIDEAGQKEVVRERITRIVMRGFEPDEERRGPGSNH
jgi:hypothetical protein